MMYMLARTDPDAPKHRGISYLIFPLDSPGVTVRPLQQMNGQAEFNEVFFEDVRVPVANRLGEENRGWYVGVTTLDFERSGIGLAVGMRQSIDRLAELAKESGALAQRPTLRGELAERTIEAEVAMQLSYRVVTMQARGLIPNHEASAAKLFSSELSQRIAATGMAVGGPFAQILDPTTRYMRAAAGTLGDRYLSSVSATIAGGTSEIQRNIIAGRGLGMPRA
jgi:alkylation response protein AidB-like acyl-CoA dehydrogenase